MEPLYICAAVKRVDGYVMSVGKTNQFGDDFCSILKCFFIEYVERIEYFYLIYFPKTFISIGIF